MMGLMLWVESELKGCRGGFAVIAMDFRCGSGSWWWWWLAMVVGVGD